MVRFFNLLLRFLGYDRLDVQVIPGESPNTVPTNIRTAGNSGERTSQVMFYVSQRLMESISGGFLV